MLPKMQRKKGLQAGGKQLSFSFRMFEQCFSIIGTRERRGRAIKKKQGEEAYASCV